MIDLNKGCITISHNANSRNRRKLINGFKGEGTPSGWVKTSPYGTYKHKPTNKVKIHHILKVNKPVNSNLPFTHYR